MSNQDALKEWQLSDGASTEAVLVVVAALGQSLPSDYLQFIGKHDGGEGFIGNSYLIIWRIEELATFNREYQVEQYAPGVLLFGSDGGGEGYGFDTREGNMPIVRVPFIGMDHRCATRVADSFDELLVQLAK